MKNKYGFTLIEILAVVAILGILSLIAVPNVIKYLKSSQEQAMATQENTIADAANLYNEDYCIHPIGNRTCGVCTKSDTISYVRLSVLENLSLIDKVKYKDSDCDGVVVWDSEARTKKTYLVCENDTYSTDSSIDLDKDYPEC
jgi:prepilin-type N-terminal cleavage/methylation domain-containing protein